MLHMYHVYEFENQSVTYGLKCYTSFSFELLWEVSKVVLSCLAVYWNFFKVHPLWTYLKVASTVSFHKCLLLFSHSIPYTQDMLKSCLAGQLPCLANSSLLHQHSIISTSSLFFKCTEFFSSVPLIWRILYCNKLQRQVLWAPKMSFTLLLSEMISKAAFSLSWPIWPSNFSKKEDR